MSQSRIKKVQVLIDELNLNSLLISNPLNIYYLTGFKGVSVTERETLVLIKRSEAIFFVPQIYMQEGQKFAKESNMKVIPTEERHVLFQEAAKSLNPSESVGFEETNLRFNEYKVLSDSSKAKLVPTSSVVEYIRIIKDNN